MQVWERGNGKLCVNTIVDCIYCSLRSKEIAHPNNWSCFLSWGKKTEGVSDRCDSTGYFQNTHTHTHTHKHTQHTHTHTHRLQQQHYGAEMLIWGTSVSCDQKWLLTLYTLSSTNNNKKHNHENHYNTHSTHSTMTTVSSQRRSIDQVKTHKSL